LGAKLAEHGATQAGGRKLAGTWVVLPGLDRALQTQEGLEAVSAFQEVMLDRSAPVFGDITEVERDQVAVDVTARH